MIRRVQLARFTRAIAACNDSIGRNPLDLGSYQHRAYAIGARAHTARMLRRIAQYRRNSAT